jgi:hypothetical protein
MAVLETIAEPKKRITMRGASSPLPGFLAVFWVLIALAAVDTSVDRIVRYVAVLVVMGLAFWAGDRWGRAAQAREILRGSR